MEKQESRAGDGNFVLEDLRGLTEHLRSLRLLPKGYWAGRSPYPLCATLVGCGCEVRTTTDYDWYGLRRGQTEFVLFQYTLAGEGRLTHHGVHHVVRPGTLMLLTIPDDHRYYLAPGQQWEHFYLCLSGSEVLNACRKIIAQHGPLIALAPTSSAITQAVAAYERLARNQITSVFDNSQLAYGVAMALLQDTVKLRAPESAQAQLARAEAYCREHFSEELSISELAKIAGFSRYHFARLFRQSHGVSPNEFLIDLRISTAARMLRDSHSPVKAIAQACGFSDAGYFCKVFRRAVGVSPGSFRDSDLLSG